MSDKIYCEQCRHYFTNDSSFRGIGPPLQHLCKIKPSKKDTFKKQVLLYARADIRNRDNDCGYFEPKRINWFK